MLLKCEIIGENDRNKAAELLTKTVKQLMKNGGIVPRKLTLKELKERGVEE